MEEFFQDEEGYISWCKKNSSGYVFNFFHVTVSDNNKLHKGSCLHLWYPDDHGKRTSTRKKICSNDLDELLLYIKNLCGNSWTVCKTCRPLDT